MKQFIFFLLIAGLVYACGNAAEESAQAIASTKGVKKKIDGERVYKQYCVTCHGLYGDMGAAGALDLSTSQLSMDERVHVITNGRNAMTPFKSLLSEEKIKAVAEYTLKLAEKK